MIIAAAETVKRCCVSRIILSRTHEGSVFQANPICFLSIFNQVSIDSASLRIASHLIGTTTTLEIYFNRPAIFRVPIPAFL